MTPCFEEKKSLLRSRQLFRRIFIATLIFVSAWSCNFSSSDTYHEAYFGPVLHTFDSIREKSNDAALKYLDSAYEAFPNPGVPDLAWKYHKYADYYVTVKQDPVTSIRYSDSSIVLLKNINNINLYILKADVFFKKAETYVRIRNYKEAITNYNLGRIAIISTKGYDTCRLRGYYEGLANLYYAQQNYQMAILNFKKNYELANRCLEDFDRFVYMQGNLDNIGMCYQFLNLFDSSLYYYNTTLKFIAENEKQFPRHKDYIDIARMVIYKNMASLAALNNDTAMCKQFASIAINLAMKYEPGYAVGTRLTLVNIYLKSNQFKEAGYQLAHSESLFKPNEVNSDILEYYELSYQYHLSLKDNNRALTDLQRSIIIKDSLQRRDQKFHTLDLEKEFEYREQKSIDETLKKDNELKRIYLASAVIAVFAAVGIIIFVWYHLRRSVKHVQELNALNIQIRQQVSDVHETLYSLEQSNRENERLTRLVAHDLRNPISAIQNLIFSLLQKEPLQERKEIMVLIKESCVSCLGLINDLLNDKKKENKQAKEKVNMAELLKKSIDQLQSKADEKYQRLLLEATPVSLLINRQNIWRVIGNIISNAIKFSYENTDINIRLQTLQNSVLFSVHDTGVGIPGYFQDKVFSYDNEASQKGTLGEESYGLGLLISKKFVEEHNGKLWFESEVGKGSIFYVELPLSN